MRQNVNVLRVISSVFGVYAGLFGMEHGYMETLQGNVAPNGIRILAANPIELPFPFGHEPAITVIPNFFITGILAIIFSMFIIIWAAGFVQRKNGSLVLLLLSIILLLVGGGLATITLLLIATLAATGINRSLTWWHAHLSPSFVRFLARLWSWIFAAALLFLPLEVILGYVFGVKNDPDLNLNLAYLLLALFLLTLITGLAHEIRRRFDLHPATARNY